MATNTNSRLNVARCAPGPRNSALQAVAAAGAALDAPTAAAASPPLAWPDPPEGFSAAAGDIWRALVQARPAEDWNPADLFLLGRMCKSYESADACRELSSAFDASDEFAKMSANHVRIALAYARTLKLHEKSKAQVITPQDQFVADTHKLLNMEFDLG